MVKYAMPAAKSAVSAVKQTVKTTTDYAKYGKSAALKLYDAGKNKLQGLGKATNKGLNSFAGSLNKLNDNYIGGRLNKANEKIISPKIEKFAVKPFTKLIGTGPGPNATLKQQLAWAGKATAKSVGITAVKSALDVGGAMLATGLVEGSMQATVKTVAKAGYRAATNLNYNLAAKYTTSTAWRKGIILSANVAKGIAFQAMSDLNNKKISSPEVYLRKVGISIFTGAAYSPAPNSLDVNKAVSKLILSKQYPWVELLP